MNIEKNIARFEAELAKVNRPGMDKLLAYIRKSDFYKAPASTKYHLSCEGGLLQHSLNVLDALRSILVPDGSGGWEYKVAGQTVASVPDESVVIAALLHDICKTFFYTTSWRNAKNEQTGKWEKVPYEAFLASYATTLDMCLQGIMSPATLGIDVGKMSSAEAQREKKDVTGITRNAITDALEKALPQLAQIALAAQDLLEDKNPGTYKASISFGEYGAPSFDNRVQTVGAAANSGVMSVEAQVDELWGASKDDEWKAQEVARIRFERGIEVMPEPDVGTGV